MIKTWTCPVCTMPTNLPPALCRRDNKTEICPQCGTNQAIEDFVGQLEGITCGLEDAHTDLETAKNELLQGIDAANNAKNMLLEQRSNEHQYPDLSDNPDSMVNLLDPEGLTRKALAELTILKSDPADKHKEMVNEDHAASNQSESDSYPE